MSKKIEICVIDDEQIVCERLRPELEKRDYSVETFVDSTAALKRLSEKKFDVLITDVKMAGPSGLDLMRHVKTYSHETRVIIITGFATVETAKEAMKGGAVDFIAKPFRLSAILDLVGKISEEIRGAAEDS
ncbi:MAG: response regulator [bacterium]